MPDSRQRRILLLACLLAVPAAAQDDFAEQRAALVDELRSYAGRADECSSERMCSTRWTL